MNRSTEIRLDELKTKRIQLGFVGENLYRQVWFMCDEIYAEFPHAAAALTVMPPKGQSYPAVLERVDNAVVWNITDSDLAYRGRGEIQLSFVVDEMVAKTYVGRFEIERSLSPQGEAPTGIDDFLTRAGAALTAIPETIDAALEEAKESHEFDGPPGKDGKDGQDGKDGKDGKDGQDGAPGQDGQDGHDGAPGRDGTDGTNGQDGTDAYVWIRYAAANPTADADMKTSPDAWIGIYSGDAATAPEHYTDYAWYKIKGEPGAVQDVQVNGTTVLGQGGVANIPLGTDTTPGVMKVGAGLFVQQNGSTAGQLTIYKAGENEVKAGDNGYEPIVPQRQHMATFYGLAKAAGVDMKNSSNPVGTFTPEALVAIQKMLGIYEAPWELIREGTFTNAEEADHVISVDGYGNAFELTDAILLFETPQQETYAKVGDYGTVRFGYGTNSYYASQSLAWEQAANSNSHGAMHFYENKNGLAIITSTNQAQTNSKTGITIRYMSGFSGVFSGIQAPGGELINKVTIRAITGTGHYKLYGKRKWN